MKLGMKSYEGSIMNVTSHNTIPKEKRSTFSSYPLPKTKRQFSHRFNLKVEVVIIFMYDRIRFAKTQQTYKPGLEEGFGQNMRKVLLTVLRYPSAGKVGIN